jgi:hypothetical protein
MSQKNNNTIIAITIDVGRVWERLAELAAESVRLRTGLETRVLGEEAMARYGFSQPHWLKFRLFEEFPDVETILYFDADTIFLAEWDPRVLAGRGAFLNGRLGRAIRRTEIRDDIIFPPPNSPRLPSPSNNGAAARCLNRMGRRRANENPTLIEYLIIIILNISNRKTGNSTNRKHHEHQQRSF